MRTGSVHLAAWLVRTTRSLASARTETRTILRASIPCPGPGGACTHDIRDRLMNTNASVVTLPDGRSLLQTSGPAKVRPPGRLVLIAGMMWIALLATGFLVLAREEFTPVVGTAASPTFPPHSTLALAKDAPTLILFAHPHCPCTRASLHELAELMASLQRKVAMTVVFTLPKGVAPHWEQGELWQEAAAIPGVHVALDQDGQEAGRFEVKGSGHVLLYQPSGQLVFSGGITPSRGHEGDNPGRTAVVSLVLQGHSPVNRTPVYGCPLLEPPDPSPSP